MKKLVNKDGKWIVEELRHTKEYKIADPKEVLEKVIEFMTLYNACDEKNRSITWNTPTQKISMHFGESTVHVYIDELELPTNPFQFANDKSVGAPRLN